MKSTFKGIWNGIKAILVDPIHNAWEAIKKVWDLIKDVFKNAWTWVKSVFKGLWQGVKAIFVDPVHNVIDALRSAWQGIKGVFQDAWDWVKTTFRSLWNGVKGIYTTPFHEAKSLIHTILSGLWGGIKGIISGFKSSLSGAWNGLKNIFAAPIKFLIDYVIDKGILGAWNWIAGVVPGMSGLSVSEWHPTWGGITFARGGVLPGYAPGHDKVPAMLSPGEAVLVPEVVKALGKSTILSWNAMGVAGRNSGASSMSGGGAHFAVGGILDDLNPVEWYNKFKDKVWGPVTKFLNEVGTSPVGQSLASIPGGVVSAASHAVWDWLKGLPGKILAKAWGAITDFFGLSDYQAPTLDMLISAIIHAVSKGDAKDLYQNALNIVDTVQYHMLGFSNSSPYDWHDPARGNKDMGLGFVNGSTYKWNRVHAGGGKPLTAMLGRFSTQRGLHLVGENGPELLHLPYGSRVFNNSYTMRTVGDLAGRVAARIAAPQQGRATSSAAAPITYNTTEHRETIININGNLEFPNIKSGDDAKTFVDNLKRAGANK
jgi:hypothetical protein